MNTNKWFLFFIVFFSFIACNESEKTNVETETTNKIIANDSTSTPVEFLWDIKHYASSANADEFTNSLVKLIVKRAAVLDTIHLGKFPSPLDVAEKSLPVWTDAPKGTVTILTGWWAGAGDNIFVVKTTENKYRIKWQPIGEEGELPMEELKEITIPSSHSEKIKIDDIIK